ncbi:MAG TPA: FxsA family protein [Rhodospirillales bacterium]|nr:FxsA family protein [Rhodospirillales bacterium]
MAVYLLLAMIFVPIVEIALFIKVGGYVGLWPTIGIVILTAMAGTTLLRHQGLATLGRVRESLERGLLPVTELFDGLCLLLAGAFLLTPGFFTDALGLLLFVPAVRAVLAHLLKNRLDVSGPGGPMGGAGNSEKEGGTVIEGEFKDITPDKD